MMTARQLIENLERKGRKPPTICHPDRRLSDILETMATEALTFVPVVDRGKLCGVLTYGEVLTAHEEEKMRDTLPTHGYITQDFRGREPSVTVDETIEVTSTGHPLAHPMVDVSGR